MYVHGQLAHRGFLLTSVSPLFSLLLLLALDMVDGRFPRVGWTIQGTVSWFLASETLAFLHQSLSLWSTQVIGPGCGPNGVDIHLHSVSRSPLLDHMR